MKKEVSVKVNGVLETVEVAVNQSLLHFLRDTLNLTGAKEGCNEGECGSCIVLLDGKAINSCLTLAVEANGREVTTIEGIGSYPKLHPLQQAFLKHTAVQCGFCTPGMIMTAVALLEQNPTPDENDVRYALSGNLCRCTGYRQIIDAVLEAASTLRHEAQVPEEVPA
jgi:carbon-monoxide dehydrogenase small subunit